MSATEPRWEIECRCKWCGELFVRMEIDHARAWVCPTEACRERQLQWKRVDLAGNLFYMPLPVQVEFHDAIQSQQYGAICIGGHRGSSKSIALRMAIYNACEQFHDFTALFFRRTLIELELNQGRFFEIEAARIGAEYAPKKVVFPKTNAQVRFAHSNAPDDYKRYIGADVDLIALEQIEEFLQKQVAEIGASTGRSTKYDHWRGLLLATENPGGPLSDFVDQLFVRRDLNRARYPHYNPANYHFIEARLEDNPWTDARYEQNLAILSPARREMFRHGRRDIFEGQFFDDFLKESHVVAHRPILKGSWFRAMQWGYHDIGYVLWIGVESSRHMTVGAILPLEKLNEDACAAKILKIDRELNVRPSYIVANREIFGADPEDTGFSGQTIAETLNLYGVPVTAGDPDELNGWKRVHACLRVAPDTLPWLRVHEDCEALITAFQHAMSADTDADLISDESPNLKALQALRLGLMSRPAPEFASKTTVYPEYSGGWWLERGKREGRHAS